MQTKLQTTQEMLQGQVERLWNSTEEYRSFLRTSSRLYKYGFKDQALIHAQRPDATAVAEFDTWSKENLMNRFIRRGSKGIALLTEDKGRAKLRYVFDYADTGARDECTSQSMRHWNSFLTILTAPQGLTFSKALTMTIIRN